MVVANGLMTGIRAEWNYSIDVFTCLSTLAQPSGKCFPRPGHLQMGANYCTHRAFTVISTDSLEPGLFMTFFICFSAFLLGACLGSFANVCVWRIPRPGLSPTSPARSLCPRCGFKLAWYDNVPILSWLFLGGSCRSCGGGISFRYTAIELLTALMVCGIAYRFLCADPFTLMALIPFMFWTLIFWGLLVSAFIDLELMILPDEIMLPSLAMVPWFFFAYPRGIGPSADILGGKLANWAAGLSPLAPPGYASLTIGACVLLGCVILGECARRRIRRHEGNEPVVIYIVFYILGGAYGWLVGQVLSNPGGLLDFPGLDFIASLMGVIAGALLIWLIRFCGQYVFAQEAMGFGDLKLMALIGAMTGVDGVLWTLAMAALLGSVVGIVRYLLTGDRQLPFGPFLIAAGGAVFFLHPRLVEWLAWYGRFIGHAR